MISNGINEIKNDLEQFINFMILKYYNFKHFSLIKKLWLLILIMSTILIFYWIIIISFYIVKYSLKYIFILLNLLFYKLNNKFYNNNNFIYIYICIYIWLDIINKKLFYYIPILIINLKHIIINYFYINYLIKNFFIQIKSFLDKKLYNIYLTLEYIFKFSYIIKWKKFIENYYLIFKKYSKLYILIIMDKTKIIRKKLYIYFLYICNIKRSIFWSYFFIIYCDLLFTSIYSSIYFVFIITLINIFLVIQYKLILNYTMYLLNRLEWNHVKKYFYKFYIKTYFLLGQNIIIYFTLFNNFLLFKLFKYIYEYILSWLIFKIKVNFFHWKYFLYLTHYKGCRLYMDLMFQIETLYLYTYRHCSYDADLTLYFWTYIIKGNFKYLYFIYTQYKYYNYLRIINIYYAFKKADFPPIEFFYY